MKYTCKICGYNFEGELPPAECPICHAPSSKFEKCESIMDEISQNTVLTIKLVGPNKIKAIALYREIMGVSAENAKKAIEESGARFSVKNPEDVIAKFAAIGTVVERVQPLAYSFAEAVDNSQRSQEYSEQKTTSDHSQNGTDVSRMGREEILNTLTKVGSIAQEIEECSKNDSILSQQIQQENAKAELLKSSATQEAQDKAKKFKIICIVIGLVACAGVVTIPLGIIIIIIGIIKSKKDIEEDIKSHKVENEAAAQQYIEQHVAPLVEQRNEIRSKLGELYSSGKIEWAVDVVGKDMFNTQCIGELYNLIKGRRADNLKEALNLFDNNQYKDRMEGMQRAIQNASEIAAVESAKQTEHLKDISKDAHQAATAAKIAAVNTYGTYLNTRDK